MAKTFRERAEELVAQMTLEEKVSQTSRSGRNRETGNSQI